MIILTCLSLGEPDNGTVGVVAVFSAVVALARRRIFLSHVVRKVDSERRLVKFLG